MHRSYATDDATPASGCRGWGRGWACRPGMLRHQVPRLTRHAFADYVMRHARSHETKLPSTTTLDSPNAHIGARQCLHTSTPTPALPSFTQRTRCSCSSVEKCSANSGHSSCSSALQGAGSRRRHASGNRRESRNSHTEPAAAVAPSAATPATPQITLTCCFTRQPKGLLINQLERAMAAAGSSHPCSQPTTRLQRGAHCSTHACKRQRQELSLACKPSQLTASGSPKRRAPRRTCATAGRRGRAARAARASRPPRAPGPTPAHNISNWEGVAVTNQNSDKRSRQGEGRGLLAAHKGPAASGSHLLIFMLSSLTAASSSQP